MPNLSPGFLDRFKCLRDGHKQKFTSTFEREREACQKEVFDFLMHKFASNSVFSDDANTTVNGSHQ